MENNNTPRKARIYYKGESIPVLVVSEDDRFYLLLTDWEKICNETTDLQEITAKRNLYVEAVYGYEAAGRDYASIRTNKYSLYLNKGKTDVTLVFDEPEEAQDNSIDDTGIDDVPPFLKVPRLTDLEKQLILLGHADYKVKSFDVRFQDGGEAHLCATFTKEVDN